MKPFDKILIAAFLAFVVVSKTDNSSQPKPEPDIGNGMRVLWVVEEQDNVPQYIKYERDSATVREYLNSHCAKDNGQPGYRCYDPQTDVSNDPQIWKDMLAAKRDSIPWLYIAKGRKVSSGVPPKDIPSLMTLLQKHGGQ